MIRKGFSLVFAVILLLSCTSCAPTEHNNQEKQPVEATYAYTDDCGRIVEVPEKIQRVVPSGPVAQMFLLALAPETMVGLASRWPGNAENLINESVLSLPTFGELYGSANLNVETLAMADPQIILDIGTTKKTSVEDLDMLQKQTCVPSVHIDFSMSKMNETLWRLGKLLGKEDRASQLIKFFDRIYNRTVALMQSVGEDKRKVLYIQGNEGNRVIARDSAHAELLDFLADNLAVVEIPSSKGTGNEVTVEQVALWNPEIFLFGPDSIYETVAEKAAWRSIPAIQQGNYVEVPADPYCWMGNPPSTQLILGMIWLPAVLYPNLCNYDVSMEVHEFYRLFYGGDLSGDQYRAMTVYSFIDQRRKTP